MKECEVCVRLSDSIIGIMLRKYLKCVWPYSLSLFPVLFNGRKFIFTRTAGARQYLIIIITNSVTKLFYYVSGKAVELREVRRTSLQLCENNLTLNSINHRNSQSIILSVPRQQ